MSSHGELNTPASNRGAVQRRRPGLRLRSLGLSTEAGWTSWLLVRLLFFCALVVGGLVPLLGLATSRSDSALPEGFVALSDIAPEIAVDLHYAGKNNFVGKPIDGYDVPRAILTRAAAEALARAHADLQRAGLGLKVLDAYRPQRAVYHFVRWARDVRDTARQSVNYPDVPKHELFSRGYLALDSAHCRGSAVDVTLVARAENGSWRELDLGTPVDFFGPEAAPAYAGLTHEQRARRNTLREALERHGFRSDPQEWWHFELQEEPFPETYFDFPIR